MPTCLVNGAKLNVMQLSQMGQGQQRDLVLCHGLASSMGFWPVEMLNAFRQHFRLTLFDQRGHGRSTQTDSGYSADDLGADLAGLIAAYELETPAIVAHSFGGVAALAMLSAGQAQAERVVLLDSQIGLGRHLAADAGAGMDATVLQALADAGINIDGADPFAGMHLITRLAERCLSDNPVQSNDKRVNYLVNSVPEPKAKRWLKLVNETQAIAQMTGEDGLTEAHLAALDLPMLLLCGANSAAMHSGRRIQSLVPECQMQVIPDAGHFFVATRADEVISRCLAFLDVDVEAVQC